MTLIPGFQKVHDHKYLQSMEAIRKWRLQQLPPGKRTHCPQGHEYTKINIVGKNRAGRQCLTCARSRQQVRRDNSKLITKELT